MKAFPVLGLAMGLDVATTQLGLSVGAIEGNPLWPMEFMIWIKTGALLVAGVLSGISHHYFPKQTDIYIRVMAAIMLGIVLNNAWVFYVQTN